MAGKWVEKRQFSKNHVIFANFLVLAVYAATAALSWFGREPVSDVAIAIITVYGAFATGGYFTLCAVRDCSMNKLEAVRAKCAADSEEGIYEH